MVVKSILALSMVIIITGCTWNSDFRDRKQPERYLNESEPVYVD